jgi:hypothetical protein
LIVAGGVTKLVGATVEAGGGVALREEISLKAVSRSLTCRRGSSLEKGSIGEEEACEERGGDM